MAVPQQRASLLNIARQLICRLVCDEKPAPVPPRQEQPAISFLPGQVHILAEYPSTLRLSKSDAVKRIQRKLEEVVQDDKIDRPTRELIATLAKRLTPERVSLLVGEQLTLAAAFGDLPSERQNPARLLRSISRLNVSIHKPPLTPPSPGKDGKDGKDGESQDRSPAQTSSDPVRQAALGGAEGQAGAAQAQPGAPLGMAAPTPAAAMPRSISPDADGFDLRAAGPNWLSSGAPHIITGGPGAVPLDETDAPPLWQFGDRTDLAAPAGDDIKDSAVVAILDSAPALQDLQNAYRTWIGDGGLTLPPGQPQNALLQQLLSNPVDGHFDVSDTGQLEVLYPFPDLTPAVVASGHEYAMSSHGLFVAGIIRSLAPQAKVRLVRVLNDHCVGTVESIQRGLELIMQPPIPTRLIVNCSFVLCVPRPGDTAPLPADLAAGNPPLTVTEIAALTQGLQDALALAAGLNNSVVAAAGNTGSGSANPLARFPAAFSDVLGVGALNDDDPNTPPLLASYSDQPDDQLNEGFAAYAGLSVLAAGGSSIPSVTSDTEGIIGAFIDPWPEQVAPLPPETAPSYIAQYNTSGLARWTGTSFAAPIVVAALANCYIRGNDKAAAIAQLARPGAPLLPGGAVAIEASQG